MINIFHFLSCFRKIEGIKEINIERSIHTEKESEEEREKEKAKEVDKE